MRSPAIVRLALGFLSAVAVMIGLTATASPQTFYGDFPFVAHWVDLLPPYNEHLVTDVGGLYLGFAVLLGWAAWSLERALLRAVCVAWLLTASLHLIFHASHLDSFGTGDAIAEIVSLALLLVPAPLALWAAAAPSSRRPEAPQT
jgi:hypothetical protein